MIQKIKNFFVKMMVFFKVPEISIAHHKIELLYIAKCRIEKGHEHYICTAISNAALVGYNGRPTWQRNEAVKQLHCYIKDHIYPYRSLDSTLYELSNYDNISVNNMALCRMAWIDKMRAMIAEDETACGYTSNVVENS